MASMGFLKHHTDLVESQSGTQKNGQPAAASPASHQRVTLLACFLGLVASIGGFMFGYVRYVLPTLTPTSFTTSGRSFPFTMMIGWANGRQ